MSINNNVDSKNTHKRTVEEQRLIDAYLKKNSVQKIQQGAKLNKDGSRAPNKFVAQRLRKAEKQANGK